MTDFIVLGASGSLSQKMLSPALERITKDNREIKPIGYGRSEKPKWWKWHYIRGNYSEIDKIVDKKKKTVFYLALPIKVEIVKTIVDSLSCKGRNNKNWQIAIEKPFGGNLNEAEEIRTNLKKIFKEEQIYPVDHYLTKDLVKDIISFRFANPIIEEIWKPENIEKITVTAWEKEGIENRGAYYDQFGAIKDMIQNHLLQILLLATIKRPECLGGGCLSTEKQKQIRAMEVVDLEIGQYKGYREEKEVRPDSKTETWAKLSLKINEREWKGVDFILQSGKRMKEKLTEVEIVFKQNLKCLWEDQCYLLPKNKIVINLYPKNEVEIFLNHGTRIEKELPESIPMKLGAAQIYKKKRSPYEEILLNIVEGSRINFASFEEIIEAWKLMKKVDIFRSKVSLKTY